jgi:hypothetical protein
MQYPIEYSGSKSTLINGPKNEFRAMLVSKGGKKKVISNQHIKINVIKSRCMMK